MSDQPVRVVVVEDDYLVAEEIKRAFRGSRYQIVGEGADGRQAIELVVQLRPDMVLMDIRMPEMDGLTASRRISEENPVAIVIMTAFESPELVAEAA